MATPRHSGQSWTGWYNTEEDLKRVLLNVSYETDKYHKNYLWVLCRSFDQGAALGVDSRTELRRISSTG